VFLKTKSSVAVLELTACPRQSLPKLQWLRILAAMRMPITDILHRGVVTSLVGLTLYGMFLGVTVHRETLRKGRGKQMSANFIVSA
jgi:hypothetical protein